MQRTRTTPQALMERAMRSRWYAEKMQTPRKQTMYTMTEAPIFYVAQKIIRAMQDAAFPTEIKAYYRTPETQSRLHMQRLTRYLPNESPHQYCEAVDLSHPSDRIEITERYWKTFRSCVVVVAERLNVDVRTTDENGHIEFADWRERAEILREKWRETGGPRRPNEAENWQRFQQKLPKIAKRAHSEGRAPSAIDLE